MIITKHYLMCVHMCMHVYVCFCVCACVHAHECVHAWRYTSTKSESAMLYQIIWSIWLSPIPRDAIIKDIVYLSEGEATDCSQKLLVPLLFPLHSSSMICYSEEKIQEQQKLPGLWPERASTSEMMES